VTGGQGYDDCLARSRAARIQEHAMETAAAAAAGIGEHGCANACYRVAAIFRQKAIYWNTQACLTRNPDYPRRKQQSAG
jgi:hypothetical protein